MEDAMKEELKSRKRWKLRAVIIAGVVLFVCFWAAILDSGSNRDKRWENKAFMTFLNEADSAYIADNGAWPKKIDNAGLFAVLSGADSGKVYMTFKTRNISPNGELLDDWGTPLQVTRVSDTELKIESAGPDKIFGTADDIMNQ